REVLLSFAFFKPCLCYFLLPAPHPHPIVSQLIILGGFAYNLPCLVLYLLQLENYIVENMKSEMAQIQQNAVQNHTATMLEIGTSLLSQTAEQTRKLTDVETQVLNQTSRLEIQLLENSLSTYKLEKQLLQQTNEILKIHEKNRSGLLYHIIRLKHLHWHQCNRENSSTPLLPRMKQNIYKARRRKVTLTTFLAAEADKVMDCVHKLQLLLLKDAVVVLLKGGKREEEKPFRDCADVYQAGFNKSGIYTIYFNNMPEPKKVFCNMDVNGGGWTVIQHREDGSLDFQRGWKEYKMGFGNPSGEYWLGNEFIFAITSQRQYTLRIELMDWEGNRAYSQYDRFHIGNEKQNYRLYLKGHTGTAGKQSSLILHGADFSTKDADNDNCMCKCALMLTGGWWFDACGPSNLNGMFYTAGQNHGKLNGIKWHYFKGPSYSLRSTTMMIRPLDF
uniref:Angiopoietin-1 n=1 Tax=Cricetulus griseus TaxID=10029 RepID=A0A8C2LWB1_CRIGR